MAMDESKPQMDAQSSNLGCPEHLCDKDITNKDWHKSSDDEKERSCEEAIQELTPFEPDLLKLGEPLSDRRHRRRVGERQNVSLFTDEMLWKSSNNAGSGFSTSWCRHLTSSSSWSFFGDIPTGLLLPSQLYPAHTPLKCHPLLYPNGPPLKQCTNKYGIKTLGPRTYKIGQYISSGAFARVFHCQVKLTENGQRIWVDAVAKFNMSRNSKRAQEMTERELQVLFELQGISGVPELYGRIRQPHPAIVMSFGGNITLSRLLLQKDFTAGTFIDIMISVGRILQRIHQRGFGHYDLNGTNILLNKDMTPTVIDFGFSGDYASGHDNLSFLRLAAEGVLKFKDRLSTKIEHLEDLNYLFQKTIAEEIKVPRLQMVIDKLEKLRENKEFCSLLCRPKPNRGATS
ncbi:uncharacterized protein [Palaemon carinicauda]|uniref:uncharacterized protein n=1 Tax=Palaemon carinicauda TaxID=392227 RepID=UPI0035B695EA